MDNAARTLQQADDQDASLGKSQIRRLPGSATVLVDHLLEAAITSGASDIHIESLEKEVRVRMRRDGRLVTYGYIPAERRESVVARIKVLARLDIAERRRPQDGRLQHTENGRAVDVRVSTLPAGFGEKVVLRLLDRSDLDLSLEALGLTAGQLAELRRGIHLPYGLILVTGPTGSGKTTTLYAALSEINREDINITTIENPVEYRIEGIAQAQVHAEIGFTFAAALRAFLRQDPDVILVGEIRDAETAQIAVRAAMTGHLVFATLHTNDAASAPARLVDMGAEPFLLASSLRLIVAQRLLRRICLTCSGSAPGCRTCDGTGYKGRTAAFELLPVDAEMEAAISAGGGAADIRSLARNKGYATLADSAAAKVADGITTEEEARRETGWLA